MSKAATIWDTGATQQALSALQQKEVYWLQMQPIINREISDAQFEHLRSLMEELQVEGGLVRNQIQEMYRVSAQSKD